MKRGTPPEGTAAPSGRPCLHVGGFLLGHLKPNRRAGRPDFVYRRAHVSRSGAVVCGRGHWLVVIELGAGVLGQIKYRALPAAFDVTEVHRGTPIGPALCRAVLGVQNNQHRKTKASRKRPGLHQAANARCRLVLVGQVPRGQVALVIRGVLRVFGPRGCKWAQKMRGAPPQLLHPV